MAYPDNPHFSFPFRVGVSGARVVAVEQDDDDEVMDCIMVLLQTDVGEHPGIEEYGLLDQTFREKGVDIPYVRSVISEYEDRAIADLEDYEIEELVHTVRFRISGRGNRG